MTRINFIVINMQCLQYAFYYKSIGYVCVEGHQNIVRT